LSLKLSDTRVYEPYIRARLGTASLIHQQPAAAFIRFGYEFHLAENYYTINGISLNLASAICQHSYALRNSYRRILGIKIKFLFEDPGAGLKAATGCWSHTHPHRASHILSHTPSQGLPHPHTHTPSDGRSQRDRAPYEVHSCGWKVTARSLKKTELLSKS